jgi:hypothetical protein
MKESLRTVAVASPGIRRAAGIFRAPSVTATKKTSPLVGSRRDRGSQSRGACAKNAEFFFKRSSRETFGSATSKGSRSHLRP